MTVTRRCALHGFRAGVVYLLRRLRRYLGQGRIERPAATCVTGLKTCRTRVRSSREAEGRDSFRVGLTKDKVQSESRTLMSLIT